MKILLFLPSSSYSIGESVKNAFLELGHEIYNFDHQSVTKNWQMKLNTQMFRMPYRIRNKWDGFYLREINKKMIEVFYQEKPDLIMVYNDSLLLPVTVEKIKKTAKVVFYLGDNPYYTFNKPFFLKVLMEADYTFVPDSMWVDQLRMLGICNVYFEMLGWDHRHYFPMDPTQEERDKYSSDLLFIGNTYVQNWGYKRTLFMSKFSDLDLKIYGTRNWHRWFEYFPELRDRFVLLDKPLGLEQVNLISNCSKLYPVDANPGLLQGLHARIFDCIGSGILPLVEYRKDLDRVFPDKDIPIIYSYQEANQLARYYLDHDSERKELVKSLRDFIKNKFLPKHAIKRMLDRVFK